MRSPGWTSWPSDRLSEGVDFPMNTQQEILASLHRHEEELRALSRRIWDNPESAFQEVFAARTLSGYLAEQGFAIQSPLGGLPTAFSASWGEGSPVVAFLGEYDALPGLSQAAGAPGRRAIVPGGAGHGCGHNLLGVGCAGAAVAVKEYLSAAGLPGRVIFFGCPAEERGAGKAILADAGVFEGIDACFAWHPDSYTGTVGTPSLANIILRAAFRGRASHAAAAPELGRSALDACELMNVGANYLREHVESSVRFHYAYTVPGNPSPNIVPERAELQYYVRAPRIAQARDVAGRLHKIARGAALMTETKLTWRVECEMLDFIPNDALSRILEKALCDIGAPAFDEKDRETAALYTGEKDPLDSSITPYVLSNACRSISSDVGNVSQIVPTAQVFTACLARGTALHTWQATAQTALPAADKGMLTAAGAMALAAARVIRDPDLLKAVRREHAERG